MKTSNFISDKPRASHERQWGNSSKFLISWKEMSSNCTRAGDRIFTWTRRTSNSRIFPSFTYSTREERFCGKHSQDDWSSLIFLFAGRDQFNLRTTARSGHYINPFPLPPITHISLQFTLLSINIWKSSLIQIKFLQHFLQHRYVLLWKLLKCHKIQKPKALLHEENPDHP